ncbi:MAG: head GIN domain-containing protein [Pedobacter sp.]|nr:head GIN domain-containing protein [Pedobacter sp.]MDQ8053463.1 head GIN domain-containing protein [Pedobacter sp.]
MKTKTLLRIAALLLVPTLSYMNVRAQSKNVAVKDFNSIGVSSGIDLYLTQGPSENLTIKGSQDLIKDVVVEQEGNSLTIKYKEGINWSRMFKNQSIKVYVTYKSLKAVAASGGSDVYTENTLKSDALSVAASGGSDVKLTLSVKNFRLAISGGSDAELRGTGENISIAASGGSDIEAFNFVAENAKVIVSGGSDANINVSKALDAMASGGSDINYKGNPAVKKNGVSKSGDINHVN